jgi:hypothetical protein
LSWLTNGSFTKTKPATGAGGALHPTAESWVHPQKGIRTAPIAWTMPGETDTAAFDLSLLVSDLFITCRKPAEGDVRLRSGRINVNKQTQEPIMSLNHNKQCPHCHKIIQTDDIKDDLCPECGKNIKLIKKQRKFSHEKQSIKQNTGFTTKLRLIGKKATPIEKKGGSWKKASPMGKHK